MQVKQGKNMALFYKCSIGGNKYLLQTVEDIIPMVNSGLKAIRVSQARLITPSKSGEPQIRKGVSVKKHEDQRTMKTEIWFYIDSSDVSRIELIDAQEYKRLQKRSKIVSHIINTI
jgi:hypothetical protein